MRVFRTHGVELFRNLKAFVRFEVGLTRGLVLDLESLETRLRNLSQELQRTQKQLRRRTGQLDQAHSQLAKRDRRVLQPDGKQDHTAKGITPENIIWMFGTGRSGNTWLSSMMGELDNYHVWVEPCVGELFGDFYYDERRSRQRNSRQFVLGDPARKTWLKSIRSFVLDGVEGRFRQLGPDSYVVVKEQRGSVGAPLISEALPESRMILLVRDPRDVLASSLDARQEGGWLRESRKKSLPSAASRAWREPRGVAQLAERYMHHLGSALAAYEAHGGRKVLVRYEELRADTLGTMERIYQTLEIPFEREELARVVHEHSWENIPEEKKGEGKFYRKASPGGWQEDLTPEQAKIVEEITAPLLNRFYPS